MPWTQTQQWEAISRLSTVSHSFASSLQRDLADLHTRMEAQGIAAKDPPAVVDITPLIEAETGRLARYTA